MAALEYPRWKFRYARYKTDPRPDILLLGSYKNPGTGNTLIGGVNLNYCTDKEINQIRSALDKFAAGKSLYQRYHIGRQLFPSVFTNKYRTYKASEIKGLEKDVIYPTMGVLQRIGQFAKSLFNKALGRTPNKQEIEDLDNIDPESYQEMQKTVQTPQEFDDKLDVAIKDIDSDSQVPVPEVEKAQEEQQAATDARLTSQMSMQQETPPEADELSKPDTELDVMQAPETVELAEPTPELQDPVPFEEPEEIEATDTPEQDLDEVSEEKPVEPVISQKIDQALARTGNKPGEKDLGMPGA